MEVYEYKCKLYIDEDAINQAIEDEIASDYNNACGLEDAIASEFENSVEILNGNDFEVFKQWCEQEGINPSHYTSVVKYFGKPYTPLYTGEIVRWESKI